jgi:hypothetical protein
MIKQMANNGLLVGDQGDRFRGPRKMLQ